MSGVITMSHGSGGTSSRDLVRDLFLKYLSNPCLEKLDDAADIELPEKRICMTTDSFVIDPVFFPGGDIGKLSVCGTVNDLAVNGARPLYLTAGFIIREGFPVGDLERVIASMAEWAGKSGVRVVAGDTKVVEHTAMDGLFINTAGVGIREYPDRPSGMSSIRPGDRVIVTGPVGDHGIAVLSRRKGLGFDNTVKSDCAPLSGMVLNLLERTASIRFLRDATRGGLATVLNEIAGSRKIGIKVREEDIPVRPEVKAACELIGLDPVYIANEGRAVIIAAAEDSGRTLSALREHPEGREAALIGEVSGPEGDSTVLIQTPYGPERILPMLSGEPLPRIC